MSIDEQHLAELEAIVRSLPEDPYGLQSLRSLLANLPDPTNPDIKSARPGYPDPAPGGSGIGQALSLTSNVPIGGESGAGLGIIPEIFYGQGNLIPNPTLDAPDDGIAIGLASTAIAREWDADYDLVSGSVGTITQNIFALRGAESNAFSSSALSILINSNGTNAYDLDIFIEHPNSVLLQDMPILGHLVGAFRVWNGAFAMTAMTTITATVEIWDVTDGVVIASSVPFDLKSVTNETHRISCAIDAGDLNTAHPVRLTLHIKAVKPAATGFDPFFLWGEPYLAFNPTQAPGPFMPMFARHEVGALAYMGAGDSNPSLLVGDLQDVTPAIKFGSGAAAADIQIFRSADFELTINDPIGGNDPITVKTDKLNLINTTSNTSFAINNGGTATFGSKSLIWTRIGPWVFFRLSFIVTANGSGASGVTISSTGMPSPSAGFAAWGDRATVGPLRIVGRGVVSGGECQFSVLSVHTGATITGVDLLTNATYTLVGMYHTDVAF